MHTDRDPRPTTLTIEKVAAQAKEILLRDGFHLTTAIAEGTGRTMVIGFDEVAKTAEGRLVQLFQAGWVIADQRHLQSLSQVFYISEGWMVQRSKEDDLTTPPSQSPDRTEVLIISGLQLLSGQKQIIIYEMVRDAEGVLVDARRETQEGDVDMQMPLLIAFVGGFEAGLGSSTAN